MAKSIVPYITEDYSIPSSSDGDTIFVRHYYRGRSKIHFLIVHGAVEHSGRHMDLTKFWLKEYNEVSVTVYDCIGHGKSSGTRAYMDSFKQYVDDFSKVCEFVKSKNNEGTQNFICAHSLGGLVTLTKLLDPSNEHNFPIRGLLFSSPCIRPRTVMTSLTTGLLEKLNQITPKLHLPMLYKGSDLTRDPDRANDFDTDLLIPKFVSVRMAKEILDASSKIIGLSYYLKTPSLFLVAGADKIVDSVSTVLFAHGIDKQLTKVIQYPNHFHELWNEIDRQDIFQTMKVWVDKVLKESL